MLRQKINSLTLFKKFHVLNVKKGKRHSMLHPYVLLLINEHPEICKKELTILIYGDNGASKSSLDRPLDRLISDRFVELIMDENKKTKKGEGRIFYKVSKKGEKFLQSCGNKTSK